ncbi:MAG: hypothetical protein MRJ93_13710 [Nitrososphaeraceae archaeon]|nr:hypothetical protein [Nitrososphaeraceae archaeon]
MTTERNEITVAVDAFQDEARKSFEINSGIQKNILYSYQSLYGQFLESIPKIYWNNSRIQERFIETYNTISKNIFDNLVNKTNIINETIFGDIQRFSKNMESANRYYNDTAKNYFNYQNYFSYMKELERTSSNK